MCGLAKNGESLYIEGMENNMISIYKFGKSDSVDSFEDGVNNILYFPVKDSMDFPRAIKDKAEKMIDSIIHTYELENNCKLDLSKLCLNARMVVFMDKNGNWVYEIVVVISGDISHDDIWIEDNYIIGLDDPLYEPFKVYFMEQLEKNLFNCK